MTQAELDLAVSLATGESLREITSRGFSIADPDVAVLRRLGRYLRATFERELSAVRGALDPRSSVSRVGVPL